MARLLRIVPLLLLVLAAQAATLEYMSVDDMIAKSTAIVRGRVVASSARLHGALIYTHQTIQVLERWKGDESSQVDVVVPGGSVGGMHQTFPGVPVLSQGSEYLLFLWTGSSGLTHVIGLSQGVFTLERDSDGGQAATRAATTDAMVDSKTGRVIADQPVRIRLRDLRSRVKAQRAGEASVQ